MRSNYTFLFLSFKFQLLGLFFMPNVLFAWDTALSSAPSIKRFYCPQLAISICLNSNYTKKIDQSVTIQPESTFTAIKNIKFKVFNKTPDIG
ncbi:hypothetical protein ACS5PU_15485 [Pedobacter sp. GSP4]|uniref:hypothetical protein n=1 Tax=Pedobacter sp. GSP4 TaxID=3453716 RepID=UPI003EEC262C